MIKYLILSAFALFSMAMPVIAQAAEITQNRVWDFTVSLDGEPVGTHKFTVEKVPNADGAWRVTSKADFTVTLVGVPVFHYHHNASEQWDHRCLSQLTADTDHDGAISHVAAQGTAAGGAIQVTNGQPGDAGAQTSWTGCLMSFAYWNPDMRKQTRLLNPESGEIETVAITSEQDIPVTARGQSLQAHVWRVAGSNNPVDVLYDNKGNWVGLDAKVRGGHLLSYRLP